MCRWWGYVGSTGEMDRCVAAGATFWMRLKVHTEEFTVGKLQELNIKIAQWRSCKNGLRGGRASRAQLRGWSMGKMAPQLR